MRAITLRGEPEDGRPAKESSPVPAPTLDRSVDSGEAAGSRGLREVRRHNGFRPAFSAVERDPRLAEPAAADRIMAKVGKESKGMLKRLGRSSLRTIIFEVADSTLPFKRMVEDLKRIRPSDNPHLAARLLAGGASSRLVAQWIRPLRLREARRPEDTVSL